MLQKAIVVGVHPEDHSVDIIMVADGSRYVGVQVLSPTAATDAGVFDLPAPSEIGDKWSLSTRRAREIIAVTAMMDGSPVVVGFMFQQVNAMLFADLERRIMRHASDVYTSIDAAGNVELSHPAGVFIRIAETPGHEDLTGRDFDGRWKITRNTGRQPHLRIHLPNTDIHVDPSGNVTVAHAGNLSVTTGGSATVNVGGAAEVTVGGTAKLTSTGAATVKAPSITLDSPATTCTGALTVQGLFTYVAGLSGSGGGAASATIAGNVTVTGGEVTVDGIGVKGHHHVAPIGGNTGAAVA